MATAVIAGPLLLGAAWFGVARRRETSSLEHDVQAVTTRAPEYPDCPGVVGDWIEDVRMGPRETVAGTLADVDRDGNLDALFTNQADQSVSVWWGRRNGMPQERTDVPIGRSQDVVAVGDVNSDGVNDLVAALQDDSAFGIVLGSGRRRFGEPSRLFQSPAPARVLIRDGDGDSPPAIVFQTVTGALNQRLQDRDGWQRHTLLRELGDLSLSGLTGERVLAAGRRGASVVELRTSWHEDIAGIHHWIPGANGRTLGVTEHKALIESPDGVPTCRAGSPLGRWSALAVGDIDGDGTDDAIAADSCRECTSNHVFLRGLRGPSD